MNLLWRLMMRKTGLWIGVLILVSGSHMAYANHHEAGADAHGEKCEGMAQGDFSISGLDTNKDGVITKQEYLASGAKNAEKTFKHLDANSDGKLDLQEQKEIEAVYKAIHQQYKAEKTSI